MSQNQGLLVDTGFFIAMYDERDAHHAEAQDKRYNAIFHPRNTA